MYLFLLSKYIPINDCQRPSITHPRDAQTSGNKLKMTRGLFALYDDRWWFICSRYVIFNNSQTWSSAATSQAVSTQQDLLRLFQSQSYARTDDLRSCQRRTIRFWRLEVVGTVLIILGKVRINYMYAFYVRSLYKNKRMMHVL